MHLFKFQSVTLPNRLIANLFGPVGAYLELVNIFKSHNMDYMQLLWVGAYTVHFCILLAELNKVDLSVEDGLVKNMLE